MISRRLLLALVASLICLTTAFATLAGASALAGALEDRALAAVLKGLGAISLTLLAINSIVLMIALGLQAAFAMEPSPPPRRER